MANGKKAFPFFEMYYDAGKNLPDDIKGQFYTAIIEYVFSGTYPELSPVTSALFTLVQPLLDDWLARSKAGAKAVNSRWENKRKNANDVQDAPEDNTNCIRAAYDSDTKAIPDEYEGDTKAIQLKTKNQELKTKDYNPPVSPLPGEQDAASADLEEPKKRKRGKNAKQPEPDFSESHLSGAAQAAVRKWLDYKVQKFGKRGEYTAIGMQTLIKQTQNAVDTYGEGPVIELIDTAIAALWQGIAWDRLERKDYRGANIMPIRSKPQEKPENSTFGDAELEAMRVIQESMRC